jgi:transposase
MTLRGRLRVAENISPLPLPSHSPELNPQENVWEFLRQNKLSIRVFYHYDAIVDACSDTWNDLIARPERIASITALGHRSFNNAVVITRSRCPKAR